MSEILVPVSFGELLDKITILEIKGAALLQGYRGQRPLDVAGLAATLARVSQLIADHAERIAELDINPLFVRAAGRGVIAADALIVLKAQA